MAKTGHECMRTHYSKEITPELNGEEIIIQGWIHEIQDLGGIVFLLLRDRDGITQVTAPSKKVEGELFKQIQGLKKESVITVRGIVQESAKAPGGVEIIPIMIRVLNRSNPYPWIQRRR